MSMHISSNRTGAPRRLFIKLEDGKSVYLWECHRTVGVTSEHGSELCYKLDGMSHGSSLWVRYADSRTVSWQKIYQTNCYAIQIQQPQRRLRYMFLSGFISVILSYTISRVKKSLKLDITRASIDWIQAFQWHFSYKISLTLATWLSCAISVDFGSCDFCVLASWCFLASFRRNC